MLEVSPTNFASVLDGSLRADDAKADRESAAAGECDDDEPQHAPMLAQVARARAAAAAHDGASDRRGGEADAAAMRSAVFSDSVFGGLYAYESSFGMQSPYKAKGDRRG